MKAKVKPHPSKGKATQRTPPGTKFSPAEREQVKDRVAYLERMGYPQVEIAKEVGVSQPQVSIYLAEIKERYNVSILEERKIWVQRELAVLMDTRRMATEALKKAEKGKKKTKRESGENAKGGFVKDVDEEEELLPPSEYMAIIIKTNERICAILGLEDAPKNIFNVNVDARTVNVFDRLLTAVMGEKAAGDGTGEMPAILDMPEGTTV